MRKEKIIEVCGLSFRYSDDSDWALENVNLDVYAGEWLAIIGHNGSGKSTLAKCLNGLYIPQEGSVKVAGRDTSDGEALWEIRRLVGMVFQNPDNQFVGTTVRDDVAFGMENHGIPRDEMIVRMEEALALVGMSDSADREPHRLSGGQKQRVAIAGIIALQPAIIVLDEATSMLDPKGRSDVLAVMRRLKQEKDITVISITHDLEEVAGADRVIVMERGSVVQAGAPREIFKHPKVLLDLGLDLPFAVNLREHLVQKGIPLPGDVFLQEELVEELWKLKSVT